MSGPRKHDKHLKGTGLRFKHGSWRLRYQGKEITVGKTLLEASAKREEILKGVPDSGSVAHMLNDYLDHLRERMKRGEYGVRTLKDNESEMVLLKEAFGRMIPKDVTKPDVKRYLTGRTDKNGKPAPSRANREIALLSSAFSWALDKDYGVEENPCYGVRRNPEKPRTRYVEGRELRAFGRSAPRWLRIYCLLKYLTGLRQGDMLKLTRQNVKHGRLVVETGKTKKGLMIRKTWAVKVAINAILSLHGEVPKMNLFVNKYGEPMTSRGFKSAWQRAMQKWAKLGHERFWEHDIRGATADASEDAQALLGHGSPKMTARYRRAPAKVDPIR